MQSLLGRLCGAGWKYAVAATLTFCAVSIAGIHPARAGEDVLKIGKAVQAGYLDSGDAGILPVGRQTEAPDDDASNSEYLSELSVCQDCLEASRYNRWEQLSFFGGLDGSKQPQDAGVNANLGVRLRVNYAAPLYDEYGIGYQVGTAVDWSDNAVRVSELIGENQTRFQNHTTLGLFQRSGRWGWGAAFDFLYQDSYDNVSLSQWRIRASYDLSTRTQVGGDVRLRGKEESVTFANAPFTLRSINQGGFFVRHQFETGIQATVLVGLADEHSEVNGVLQDGPPHNNAFVMGADFTAPLNDSFAMYGETNLTMPADTGTVDAFLGVIWYPFVNAKRANLRPYAPFMPVAADTSFGVDMVR